MVNRKIVDLVVKEMAFDGIFEVKHERAFTDEGRRGLYLEDKSFRVEYKKANIDTDMRIECYELIDEDKEKPVDKYIEKLISEYK